MPFGLDLKSLIVGAIFALWVLPMIMGMFHRGSSKTTQAA